MILKDPRLVKLERKSQVITLLTVMMLAVFLMQLWLITIALEAFMAARGELALPTFLASGACFALNLWLLRYVYRIDREKD